LACTDSIEATGQKTRTKFSVKSLIPFGQPNQFRNICFPFGDAGPNDPGVVRGPGGNVALPPAINGVGNKPLAAAMLNGPVEPPGSLNHREFGCILPESSAFKYGSVEHSDQQDLWRQPYTITGPDGVTVSFGSYYVVKDTGRIHDATPQNGISSVPQNKPIAYTLDVCKRYAVQTQPFKYCDGSLAAASPFSTASPFRGALRAVNFKDFVIRGNLKYLAGGIIAPREATTEFFCTDEFGRNPVVASGSLTAPTCGPMQLLQKIAPWSAGDLGSGPEAGKSDLWKSPEGAIGKVGGALYVDGQLFRYPLPGGDDFVSSSRPQQTTSGQGCPRGDLKSLRPEGIQVQGAAKAYCPPGIGWERIIDNRNIIPPEIKAAVPAGKADDIHLPN
jgi:hypothetical protein